MSHALRLPALLALTLGALATPAAVAADAPKEATKEAAKDLITWETSFGSAIKKAEGDGKPMLFDFVTGWCPHCTRMEKTTWKDTGLADVAKKFVTGKVNCDVETVPVTRYRLTGYPTIIVADSSGDQVLRWEGYQDAATLKTALETYLGKADDMKAAMATLRKDSGDPAANIAVGSLLASVGQHDRAAERFQKALKKAQGEQLTSAAVGAATAYNATGKFKQASKALEPATKAAGDAPSAALLLARAETEKGLGNATGATELYKQVTTRFPGTPEAESATKALAAP